MRSEARRNLLLNSSSLSGDEVISFSLLPFLSAAISVDSDLKNFMRQ